MGYALFAICRFARVFHVRDLCRAYASRPSLGRFKAGNVPFGAFLGRVQGLGALVPSRHERARAASARGGSAVGGRRPPYKYGHRESAANGALPLSACASAHESSACNVHARYARYRRKKEYKYNMGTGYYLMITVPIDTTFIIKYLQIFQEKMWCHIVLFCV